MTAIEIRRRSQVGRGRDVVQSRREPLPAARRHADPSQQARLTTSSARRVSESGWTADGLGRRLAAGDTEALREVCASYGGPMLTAALHHLAGDRRLAEEAVQAAMLKAWRAAPTFDTTRPLAPWLYAIVRHCAIDLRRHEQRHKRASQESVDGELRTGQNDPFESAATAWAVRAALERLPAKEYSVMRLMYFEGLTQGQIAVRLGVALGTVKTRAARAHHRLRFLLDSQVATGRTPERRGRPTRWRD
jgi:RNA polymerase sigma-70 factor, ECF subfamily